MSAMGLRYAVSLAILAVLASPALPAPPATAGTASLQSYTGIWDMPDARVLPEGHVRLMIGDAGPYRYYGAGAGFFDRLEITGQITEINTRPGFPGEEYGDYKDRSLGLKAILVPESRSRPQLAVGAFDVTGTGLFQSRYLVLGKRVGPLDLTLGLGQGILGGSSVDVDMAEDSRQEEAALRFQISSPWRKTAPFGGIAWRLTPSLTLAAEYSPVNYRHLYGNDEEPRLPVNAGIRYDLSKAVSMRAGLMRGRDLALGIAADLPLNPEGFFGWLPELPVEPLERQRRQAFEADNDGLARIIARDLTSDGFSSVRVQASDSDIRIEVRNSRYLSDNRALARIGRIVDAVAPSRIRTLHLDLMVNRQVRQSLTTDRRHLTDYLESRLSREDFLAFASWTLDETGREGEHPGGSSMGSPATEPDRSWFVDVSPRVRTFINNRRGFLKHKALVEWGGGVEPWPGGLLLAAAETVLYNDLDDIALPTHERDPARTDTIVYEQGRGTRLASLCLSHIEPLPGETESLVTAGWLEPAFAGLSLELFRYFADGRLGVGLESTAAAKRDPDTVLGLLDSPGHLFTTAFLNLYAMVWPEAGIDAGLKIGRFLAGDPGVRIDLRRTFNHFTIGAWYTRTDTSSFESPDNRGSEKGVYIRVPIAVFSTGEKRGHFRYGVSSFVTDAGQNVRLPLTLFPADPDSLPARSKTLADEMRWPSSRLP